MFSGWPWTACFSPRHSQSLRRNLDTAIAVYEKVKKRFHDDLNQHVLLGVASALEMKAYILENRPTTGKQTEKGIDPERSASWMAAQDARREAKATRHSCP